MDAPEINPSPDCPNCHSGNTWGKHRLSREYDHPEANAFCKNCRTEFFAPKNWYMKEGYKEQMRVFR